MMVYYSNVAEISGQKKRISTDFKGSLIINLVFVMPYLHWLQLLRQK